MWDMSTGMRGASREARCILSLIGSCRRAKSMSMLDKTCDVLYIDCDTSFKYESSFIVYICSFSSNGIYIICSIMLQIGVEPSRGMPTRILWCTRVQRFWLHSPDDGKWRTSIKGEFEKSLTEKKIVGRSRWHGWHGWPCWKIRGIR